MKQRVDKVIAQRTHIPKMIINCKARDGDWNIKKYIIARQPAYDHFRIEALDISIACHVGAIINSKKWVVKRLSKNCESCKKD